MARFHCLLLPSLSTLLFINAVLSDALQASHPNHQIHQHHGFSHHHRNSNPLSWSPRHGEHATLYARSRHSHESQRRESRLLTYGDAVSPGTMTATMTTTMTTSPSPGKAASYGGARQDEHWQQHRQLIAANSSANDNSGHQSGRRIHLRTVEDDTSLEAHHHKNRQPRLAYTDLMSEFLCCRRPMQVTRFNCPCNKPLCSLPCQNGGVCWSSDKCVCPKGFTGNYCQIDVDECVTEKPCDQICRNVVGSYECYCRSGYELQPNRQSCRKNDSDGTAFEARDLEEDFEEPTSSSTRRSILRDTENEVDDREEGNRYKELLQRLIKLEKQLAKGKNREAETNEITSRISSAIDSINEIRRSIQNMQLMQQEIYELRNKVKLYDYETRKIQQLTSRIVDLEIRLRLHCRSSVFK